MSLYGAYQFDDAASRALRVAAMEQLVLDVGMDEEDVQRWGWGLTFHHQWLVLSRAHAAALGSLRAEIMVVSRAGQGASLL